MQVDSIQDRNGPTIKRRLDDLLWLQHPELKTFTKEAALELENLIRKYGLIRGLNGWMDPEGEVWILDGHHLKLVLEKMRREGVAIPDEVDVHLKLCKDKKEAAEFVLLYSTVFAKINYEGIDQHLHQYELDVAMMDDLELPELDTDYWKADLELDDTGPTILGNSDAEAASKYAGPPKKIAFVFNPIEKDVYHAALKQIKEKYGFKSMTQVLKHLVRLEMDLEDNETSD